MRLPKFSADIVLDIEPREDKENGPLTSASEMMTMQMSLGSPSNALAFNSMFLASPSPFAAVPEAYQPFFELPIYGNWCGPGHPRNGLNPPAIDAVDTACQKHDQCYNAKGYFNCDCDRDLLAQMPAAMAASPSPAAKLAGIGITGWFSNSPCVCKRRVCAPIPQCRTEQRCTTIFGQRICVPVPVCTIVTQCRDVPFPGGGGRCTA